MITPETAYQAHDHGNCIDQALRQAEAVCERNGQRLTDLRRKVLCLVWDSHKPVGAYDVLAMLSKGQDRPAAPPTVYRALDFLLEQGLIHRIASLNAYIGCNSPEHPHDGTFLICEKCRTTRELGNQEHSQKLRSLANATGFKARTTLIEISGLCPACQQESADA